MLWSGTMPIQPTAILALPEEEEIESSEEIRVLRNSQITKKTIRYKNGIVAVLLKDSSNNVFKIELRSSGGSPFWMSRNHLFLVRKGL